VIIAHRPSSSITWRITWRYPPLSWSRHANQWKWPSEDWEKVMPGSGYVHSTTNNTTAMRCTLSRNLQQSVRPCTHNRPHDLTRTTNDHILVYIVTMNGVLVLDALTSVTTGLHPCSPLVSSLSHDLHPIRFTDIYFNLTGGSKRLFTGSAASLIQTEVPYLRTIPSKPLYVACRAVHDRNRSARPPACGLYDGMFMMSIHNPMNAFQWDRWTPSHSPHTA